MSPLTNCAPAPAAGADPETWTIVFQKRTRGAYRLDLSFDRKFDSDAWSAVVVRLPGVFGPAPRTETAKPDTTCCWWRCAAN